MIHLPTSLTEAHADYFGPVMEAAVLVGHAA